jgi:catechol 2,3-dioxygenase-like lactoylglutathione lyase family enzyme
MAEPTLGHINIRTDRFEETLAFYEAVLGFRRTAAPTNPDPALNLWLVDAKGRASIHVNALLPGEPTRIARDCVLDHVAFNCTDIDAMSAHLDRLGIAYRRVPTLLPGLIQLVLADPNGIKIELTFGHEQL